MDGTKADGTSAQHCIDEIVKQKQHAKILYACIIKSSDAPPLKHVQYETSALTHYPHQKIKEELPFPLYPWEIEQIELEHPDDLEDAIYF